MKSVVRIHRNCLVTYTSVPAARLLVGVVGEGRGRAKNKPKPVPDLQSSSHKRKDSESKESQERPLKRPAASKPPQDPIKFISYCEQYYSTLLVLFNSVPRFTCTGHEDDRANEDRSRGVASHCREGARLLCS